MIAGYVVTGPGQDSEVLAYRKSDDPSIRGVQEDTHRGKPNAL
jgi:hypothetical protein